MRFVAYGLTIESEFPIPGLSACIDEPQVIIRKATLEQPAWDGYSPRSFTSMLGGLRIYWPAAGTFQICHGNEILVDPRPDVEEAAMRLFLMGPAFGILLHQRGVLLLHASVVSVGSQVVGFMGEKGWGKSTTAAALNARGHPLVADDMLAITPGPDGSPMVHAGPPQFKLWPQAAVASFGDDPGRLKPLHSQIDKRERAANSKFVWEPLLLRHLYLLDRGTVVESIPLPPAEAMLACVRHTYLSNIMNIVGGRDKNFLQCSRLVKCVTVSLLKRPQNLNALSEIARIVELDVIGLDGVGGPHRTGHPNHIA